MGLWRRVVLVPILAGVSAIPLDTAGAGKAYAAADDNNAARIYNGFKRYHGGCNHCHGPDGIGSTFGPSLVDRLPDIQTFRRIVRDGTSNGASVMKGFADDPNVEPYIDDIYAYLFARASSAIGRGRPIRPKFLERSRIFHCFSIACDEKWKNDTVYISLRRRTRRIRMEFT
jgi:mono/diheme cytochrome c family protein